MISKEAVAEKGEERERGMIGSERGGTKVGRVVQRVSQKAMRVIGN